TTQSSHIFGFGRAKARNLNGTLGPHFYNMSSYTFTTNLQTVHYQATTSPMPSGTTMVKCVVYQIEDTSSDTDPVQISDVDLTAMVMDPFPAGECHGYGGSNFTRSDTDMDWKHMVAIEDGDTPLAGKCLDVRLRAQQVEGNAISVK